VPMGRAGKPSDRRDDTRGGRQDARPDGRRDVVRTDGRNERAPRSDAPRLGDAAFRAQRDALEHAQLALRKLAAQAHGEALTQLLAAWESRDATKLPTLQELGGKVSPTVRGAWQKALGEPGTTPAGVALLRLEMAAEVPTPADQIAERRALQLQLLTRRNDPTPSQTWGQDAAQVLASAYEPAASRRLLQSLKVLVK